MLVGSLSQRMTRHQVTARQIQKAIILRQAGGTSRRDRLRCRCRRGGLKETSEKSRWNERDKKKIKKEREENKTGAREKKR